MKVNWELEYMRSSYVYFLSFKLFAQNSSGLDIYTHHILSNVTQKIVQLIFVFSSVRPPLNIIDFFGAEFNI